MSGFSLTQQLVQSLRQEQVMAPQQIQALEILLATIPELEQKIREELESNPVLELVDVARQTLAGNPVEQPQGDKNDDHAATAAEKDEALATMVQLTEDWRDYAPSRQPLGSGGGSPEDLERRQHLFDSLTVEDTLQEILLQQLREKEDLDEQMMEICAQIVGSIDETGYLRTHPSDIATVLQVALADVEDGLAIVQTFEPAGVGARDLRECLLLQLERQRKIDTPMYELVEKHLDAIERNQIPKVARAMQLTSDEVYRLLGRLRQLSPFPGRLAAGGDDEYVYPEVFVEQDAGGEWTVRSNRDYAPKLRLSNYYMKLLEDPSTPREVKSYIRDKVANSKLLMRAIEQREATIVRIAKVLLEYQLDFFEKGEEHLRPLTMAQVAEEIGVHETTVSRAIANKYMQTPRGLLTFREFFATGYRGSDGEEVSSVGIKSKLQSIVDSEDKAKPLSDQKLVKLLKEQGFKVARRTVAKYRDELGIAPSHLRRSY